MFEGTADAEPLLINLTNNEYNRLETDILALKYNLTELKRNFITELDPKQNKLNKLEKNIKDLNRITIHTERLKLELANFKAGCKNDSMNKHLDGGIMLIEISIKAAKRELEMKAEIEKNEIEISLNHLETLREYRRGNIEVQILDTRRDQQRIVELREMLSKVKNIEEMAMIINSSVKFQGRKIEAIEDNLAELSHNMTEAQRHTREYNERNGLMSSCMKMMLIGLFVILLMVWLFIYELIY